MFIIRIVYVCYFVIVKERWLMCEVKMIQENINAKMTAAEAANFLGMTLQYVHKHLKLKNLISYKSQNRVFFGYETSKQLFNIRFTPKIISFQIVKGGTGKTSLAHSFAVRSNLYGARVLCIDLDQQGNLSQAFNINPKDTPVMIDILKDNLRLETAVVNISPGLDLIPSRIENAILDNYIMLNKYPLDRVYANLFQKALKHYDVIVVDCPPALGQSVAAATLSSDMVVAPLTPEQFSLSGLRISYEEIKNLGDKFGKDVALKIVLNKFDSRTALSNEVFSKIFNHEIFKTLLCQTFIRICQEFPNTIYTGSNIFSSLKNTVAKEDIDLFTREVLGLKRDENNLMISA
jgi:chromosome partitioning protein